MIQFPVTDRFLTFFFFPFSFSLLVSSRSCNNNHKVMISIRFSVCGKNNAPYLGVCVYFSRFCPTCRSRNLSSDFVQLYFATYANCQSNVAWVELEATLGGLQERSRSRPGQVTKPQTIKQHTGQGEVKSLDSWRKVILF